MNRLSEYLLKNIVKSLFVLTAVTMFSAAVRADAVNLNMEGTTATVPKGNTVTRRIFNIPDGFPGTLNLKLKWHAVSIIPNTFNPLRVEIKHGSATLKTDTCYSIHSNKSDKCSFAINVSETEAARDGSWTLVVTNNSNDEVIGFNIQKENDANPLVPNFKSTFTPNCPDTVNLDMEGTTLTLGKGNTQERRIFGIGNKAGTVRLRAKWHAVNIIPNTFNALKIEVLKPNGTVAESGTYYSVHSNKSPKFDITLNISQTDANLSGAWKLRITNNSGDEVIGFNIAKESGEINPLVPSFTSTYKATCNF